MNSDFSRYLGRVVLFHRKRARLSRDRLCHLAGVSTKVLRSIEHEEGGNPQLENILAIFKVLNIRIKLESPLMEQFYAES